MRLNAFRIGFNVSLFLCMLCAVNVMGQQTQEQKQLALAKQFMQEKSYDKATPLFKALYDNAPFDKSAYHDYLDVLMLTSGLMRPKRWYNIWPK